MLVDGFTQEYIETVVRCYVNIFITMAVSPVTEISFEKYADMTGIPHKRVKDWCLQGVLTCRRLDDNGKEISDWSKTPKLGHWYIDIAKCIGEC